MASIQHLWEKTDLSSRTTRTPRARRIQSLRRSALVCEVVSESLWHQMHDPSNPTCPIRSHCNPVAQIACITNHKPNPESHQHVVESELERHSRSSENSINQRKRGRDLSKQTPDDSTFANSNRRIRTSLNSRDKTTYRIAESPVCRGV